jgi:predicted Fe-Mo cluster-binding NifX family protein
MKAAFACRDDRIAAVFDTARQVLVVEAAAGRVVGESREPLSGNAPAQKALRLAELGVGTLVCGAISRPLHDLVSAYGIRVIPFVAGDLPEVVLAWRGRALRGGAFAMPGCHGRRPRRCREGYATEKTEKEDGGMFGRRRGGTEPGTGQGRGGSGRRAGRMGGSEAAGPEGTCFCLQCGHREPHERGTPCFHKVCPKCGGPMGRE